jgi:hypothetical protein
MLHNLDHPVSMLLEQVQVHPAPLLKPDLRQNLLRLIFPVEL